MADLVTLDANILVYVVDQHDQTRQTLSGLILNEASAISSVVTTIALGEFFSVATRKLRLSKSAMRQQLHDLATLFRVAGYEAQDLLRAAHENEAGRFQFWDAVMLSAAERAGCTICLSEDMHDGAKLGGITVRNPFGAAGLSSAARTALGLP